MALKVSPRKMNCHLLQISLEINVDPFQLKLDLQILATIFFPKESVPSLTIFDINDYILILSLRERALLSEVTTILELILV